MPKGIVPRNAFKPGHKRPANAGRKKGVPNKITVSMREAVLLAFQGVGGVEYLKRMAMSRDRADRRAMLTLFAKLLPIEIILPAHPVDLSGYTDDELDQIRSGRITKSLAERLVEAETIH